MVKNFVLEVGTQGISRDLKPSMVAPKFWTNGHAVRFKGSHVIAMNGVEEFRSFQLGGVDLEAWSGANVLGQGGEYFIVSTSDGKVYATDINNVVTEIGRNTPYTQSWDQPFEWMAYNGLLIGNNPFTPPQVWSTVVGDTMGIMPNWNVQWLARYLRPFGSFLIALDIKEFGTSYPHRLRWSDPAEAGAVPGSWDDADPGVLAGSFTFPDTDRGPLRGGRELGENFYIYKDAAIWEMRFVGGSRVFDLREVSKTTGTDIPRSLCEVPEELGGRPHHFFANSEGFWLFDGVSTRPIFEQVFADEFQHLRNPEVYRTRSFSVVNYREQEIWFCYPEAGQRLASVALIFDFRSNTYTKRKLAGTFQIVTGPSMYENSNVISSDIPYDDTATFDDDVGFLGDGEIVDGGYPIIEIAWRRPGADKGKIYFLDVGMSDYDGSPYLPWVERESMPTVKYDPRDTQAYMVDYNVRKLVDQLTPRLFEGRIQIEVGVQELENQDINWLYTGIHDQSLYTHYLDEPLSGRFISFRFTAVAGHPFKFAGFDYNVEMLGQF